MTQQHADRLAGPTAPRPRALICGDSRVGREEIRALAETCGFTVAAALGFEQAAVELGSRREHDCLLIDFRSEAERAGRELSDFARYLDQSGLAAVVWTSIRSIDAAFAALPVDRVQFLVEASAPEAVLALTRAKRGPMDRLHDPDRSHGPDALHRISDELASFAQTLARMAEEDDSDRRAGLRDKPVSFRPAPPGHERPRGFAPGTEQSETSAVEIRELIRLRRLREQFFAADLFADPAWDMLLDLMAARLEGKQVSVSSLCIAACVPPTTALRWIATMTEAGLLVRRADAEDKRRIFIELSDEAAENMRRFLAAARRGLSDAI